MRFEFCAHESGCGCAPQRLAEAVGNPDPAGAPPGRGHEPEPVLAPAFGPKITTTAAPHRIDVHHHLVPPTYVQRLYPRVPMQEPLLRWSPQASLDDMDQAGVASAMLSLTTPGLWFGDKGETRDVARACNEYSGGLRATHGKRFGIFASMPLPDIDATLDEIAYAYDVLHADGVGVFTSYDDKWLGDAHFAPVFEELNRRRAIVFVHPTSNACCTNLIPLVTDATIEYGTDTTRTIASLVFSGAHAKYPDIRMIFSHAGGTMPFLLERFVLLSKLPKQGAAVPNGVLPVLRRFFYDTAQAANPIALGALAKVVPMSQILYGTDVPYRTCVDHVTGLAGCGFTPAELQAIDRDNALRLLPQYA